MKTAKISAALLATLLVFGSRLEAQQDVALNVTLLPNTQYEVTADFTTNAIPNLLASLSLANSPLQIIDQNGNVLAQLPAQNLIDALTGATGTVTRQLAFLLNTGTQPVTNLIARVLDPALVQVSTPTFNAVSAQRANQAPTLQIKKKVRKPVSLRLRGTASDDQSVTKVRVTNNGRNVRVHGTTSFKANVALKSGRNRIQVRAIDNSGVSSQPKKFNATAK